MKMRDIPYYNLKHPSRPLRDFLICVGIRDYVKGNEADEYYFDTNKAEESTSFSVRKLTRSIKKMMESKKTIYSISGQSIGNLINGAKIDGKKVFVPVDSSISRYKCKSPELFWNFYNLKMNEYISSKVKESE